MHTILLLLPSLIACSDFDGKTADPGTPDDTATDTADTVDTGPGEPNMDCSDVPTAGVVTTDDACTYTPSAGGAFSARVEWSMAHEMTDPSDPSIVHAAYTFAAQPDKNAVFQAPAVAHVTDDDGDGRIGSKGDRPDVAVVMGNEYTGSDTWGVLRLISGDGSREHASIDWEVLGGENYAPFVMSGVALADMDLDGDVEVVAMVISEDSGECFPGIYDVSARGELSLAAVGDEAIWCRQEGYEVLGAHAPAVADIDMDGNPEVILGRQVYASDLTHLWSGSAGRGNYNTWNYADGYWNSGSHAFAYDMDGDGGEMEIVAGRTVYNNDGSTYCELGRYDGSTWTRALDGYPAVADMVRFSGDREGEPEIVVTGNEYVSVYHGSTRYDPNGQRRCVEIGRIANDPYQTSLGARLPAHPDCNLTRSSFGGPPTIADFGGDGTRRIGVAGACHFTVYEPTPTGLEVFGIAQTRDWSSASTGSTVFDFNGDGTDEVVFSDEEALTVWQVSADAGLDPWERFTTLLRDENHGSWTIHEYPLVADVDGDGKAEIVVSNEPRPDAEEKYGLYVLGAADDDWVTARPIWNQHAYYVTNVEDDGAVGYGAPNYAPYTSADYNSFRLQAPGAFGEKAASDLLPRTSACQAYCGDPATIWVQVGNEGSFITAGAGFVVSLYGVTGGTRTLLERQAFPADLVPGALSSPLAFEVADWAAHDRIEAVVDDPAGGSGSAEWGTAKECDETDNTVTVDLSALCE
jgi:hypothetical protein